VIPDSLLPHSVVKVRPVSSTDGYGDTAYDYGVAATRTTISGRVQQDQRSEVHDALRDATSQTWTLFTNHTDIRATDRIEWAGHPSGSLTFEVWGPPEPAHAGPATAHHMEVTLMVRAG